MSALLDIILAVQQVGVGNVLVGLATVVVLLPALALVMWTPILSTPLTNNTHTFVPDPSRALAPVKKWKPDTAQQKEVLARLAVLKPLRRSEDKAYPSAVYSFRTWAASVYTGSMRAHVVPPRRKVQKSSGIARPDYATDGNPDSEMAERMSLRSAPIRSLPPEQIAGMRVAGRLGREVLDIAGLAALPGVRCDEIDTLVHEACLKRKCYPSPLNYMKFPKSVCTSVNEVVCHGVPDSYELKKGDIINVDVTVYYGGFHADLNETYFVGGKEAADEDTVRLLQTAYECLFRAIETVKPGQLYRSLGGVIQPHAEANGCSVVRTYMGHGINSLFHTTPLVPHYKANKAVGVMKCGHTFTIEPMLNAGGWKDKMWPDGWTVVTVDGSFSAQFEHTLLVTDEGVEILTARLPSSRADVVVCYRGEVV